MAAQLDFGHAAHELDEHAHAVLVARLHQAFHAFKQGRAQAHALAGFEAGELQQIDAGEFGLVIAQGLQAGRWHEGLAATQLHGAQHAQGAAHHMQALAGAAGPVKHIARKHGHVHGAQARAVSLHFAQAQEAGFKALLGQLLGGPLFLSGFGVGEQPGGVGALIKIGLAGGGAHGLGARSSLV